MTHDDRAHDRDEDRNRLGSSDDEHAGSETVDQSPTWQGNAGSHQSSPGSEGQAESLRDSQGRSSDDAGQSMGGKGSTGQGSSMGGQGWQDPSSEGSQEDTETGDTASSGEREQTARS